MAGAGPSDSTGLGVTSESWTETVDCVLSSSLTVQSWPPSQDPGGPSAPPPPHPRLGLPGWSGKGPHPQRSASPIVLTQHPAPQAVPAGGPAAGGGKGAAPRVSASQGSSASGLWLKPSPPSPQLSFLRLLLSRRGVLNTSHLVINTLSHALAGRAQWVERRPVHRMVAGAGPGCRFKPCRSGCMWRQLIGVPLSH